MRIVSVTQPSPAQRFVDQAQWLLAKGSVVVGLEMLGDNAVRVLVEDPFVTDPKDRIAADRYAADSALAVLEQAAHGVRLIPMTRAGYLGRPYELAPAQLTFLTALPGVQRSDLVPTDVDGNGTIAPGEQAYHVEVDSTSDRDRIDWLLRDKFDEGTVEDGPVRVIVPKRPFLDAIVPAPGASRA